MISVGSQWDRTTLDLILQAFRTLPEKTDKVLRRTVRPIVSRYVDQSLRKPPPVARWTSSNPPPWTSGKQRRAYFWTNGFGMGIPTRAHRTNQYIRAWHVNASYKNNFGTVTVTNTDPAADFIGGVEQQLFHALTGWIYAPDVIAEAFVEAEFAFVEGLLDLLWEGIF